MHVGCDAVEDLTTSILVMLVMFVLYGDNCLLCVQVSDSYFSC